MKWGYLTEREAIALRETTGPDKVDLAVALCKDNLPLFGNLFLGRDPAPHIPPVWKEMKDHRRLILELPRDHLKTSRFVVDRRIHRIAYASICIGSNPRILILNETGAQADKTYTEIKNKLLGAHDSAGPKNMLGEAFGDFNKRVVKSGEGLLYMDLGQGVDRDPTLESVGFEGSITGGHPSDGSVDDVDSLETVKTAGSRESRWTTWSGTFEGLFGPGTQVTFSCTPKAEDDTRGHLKKGGLYESVRHPAFNRMPMEGDFEPVLAPSGKRTWVKLTKQGLGLVEGVPALKAMWPCPQGECPSPECADGKLPGIPFHRSVEYLLHDKYLENRFTFSSEYMLEHRSSDEQPIKKHMLRFFSFDDADVGKSTEWNEHPIVRFPEDDLEVSVHAWDHAISKSRRADNTALARVYKDSSNNVYCWVTANRWDAEHVRRMMETQFLTDPHLQPTAVVTEAISFQEMFGKDVLGNQSGSGSIVPIVMVKKPVDKLTAMVENGYLNHLMNGKVFFHCDDRENVMEHLMFTGAGTGGMHDDRVDACRLAFGQIRQGDGISAGIIRAGRRRRNRLS